MEVVQEFLPPQGINGENNGEFIENMVKKSQTLLQALTPLCRAFVGGHAPQSNNQSDRRRYQQHGRLELGRVDDPPRHMGERVVT